VAAYPSRAQTVGLSLALGAWVAGCSTVGSANTARHAEVTSMRAAPTAWTQTLTLPPPRIVSMADEAGQQALRDGRPEVALEWFRRAADANPDLVSPINGAVVALARLERFGEAAVLARDAAARGLQSTDLDANLAWLEQRLRPPDAGPVASAGLVVSPVTSPTVTPASSAVAAASSQAASPTPLPQAAPDAATAASPAMLGRVRLEVSNGTGVLGLARRTADQLSQELGGPTARVRNHGHFGVEQTELRLRPEMDARARHALARELARTLGVSVAIVRTSDLAPGVDAQLVLGVDTQAAVDRRAGRFAVTG
jgi:hypothetical protein